MVKIKNKKPKEVKVLDTTDYKYKDFKKIYDDNRLYARIFAIENKPTITETVQFINGDKNYDIVTQTKSFGVSKTLKLFCSKKITRQLIVKPSSIYLVYGGEGTRKKIFTQATYKDFTVLERDIIESDFPFIKFMKENEITLSLNTVIKYSLYDLKKCLTKMYGYPYPQAKKLHDNKFLIPQERSWTDALDNRFSALKTWKLLKQNCIGIEKINEELLKIDTHELSDCIRMLSKLCKPFNFSWSTKRVKQEHDDAAMMLAEIQVGFKNMDLRINQIFLDFAEYSGITIFKTSGELVKEGILKKHCVGGYANEVNSGRTAIYSYDKYTLQISLQRNYPDNLIVDEFGSMINIETLHINQFKGYRNQDNPNIETVAKVQKIIDGFNKILLTKHQDGTVYEEPRDLFTAQNNGLLEGGIREVHYANVNDFEL